MRRQLHLLSALALISVGFAPDAAAQDWTTPPAIGQRFIDRPSETRAEVRPLHEVLPMVRRQLDGDFVGLVNLVQTGDRPYYVLRWRFSDGRIADLRVDAQSGAVLDR
jgi:uncharacterized membrane protein YkoI